MFVLFIIAMIYDTNKSPDPFVGFEYCQLGGLGVLFMIQTASHVFIVLLVFLLLMYSWMKLRRGMPGTHLVRTVTLTRMTLFSLMTMVSIIFTSLFFVLDYYQKVELDVAVYLRPITSLLGNTAIAAQAMAVSIFLLTHPVIVEQVKQLRHKLVACFVPTMPRSLDPLQETIFNRLPEHILITSDVKMIDEAVRRDVIYQVMLGLTEVLRYGRKLNPTPPGQTQPYQKKKRKFYVPHEFHTNIPEIGVLIAQDFLTVQQFRKIKCVTTTSFSFHEYCPRVFRAIRLKLGISDDDFADSFRPESVILDFIKKNFSEGKSQSFFCFTENGQFIIKTVTRKEKKCLLRVLGTFQKHIFDNPQTLIRLPLGLYTLHAYGFTTTFIALSNCMCGKRRVQRRFDLKGSKVARKAGVSASLGKDTDLKTILNGQRFTIPHTMYDKLEEQLKKDAKMFCSLNIMDYSLLMGYEEFPPPPLETQEDIPLLVHTRTEAPWHSRLDGGIITSDRTKLIRFGIIDVLQEYNLSKKVEHLAKVAFKCANGKEISAINSNDYCDRFISKILDFFEPGDELPENVVQEPPPVESRSISMPHLRKSTTNTNTGFLNSFKTWFRSGEVEMQTMDSTKLLSPVLDLDALQSIHVLDDDDLMDEEAGRGEEERHYSREIDAAEEDSSCGADHEEQGDVEVGDDDDDMIFQMA